MALLKIIICVASGLVGSLLLLMAALAVLMMVSGTPLKDGILQSTAAISLLGAFLMWPMIRCYRNGTVTWTAWTTHLNRYKKAANDLPNKVRSTAEVVSAKMAVARAEQEQHKKEAAIERVRIDSFIASVKYRASTAPLEVIVLGGSGWESEKGNKFLLSLDDKHVYMSDLQKLTDTMIEIDHLIEMKISGPGKVTSGGGVMGGGFGAEGALKGIAIATVINILTTHSSTKTVIRLSMRDTELVMLTSKMEPDQAELMLSPIGVSIRKKSQTAALPSVTDKLQKLHDLKVSGVISDDEFARLKENLIRNGV